jgi:hypothetical protein
MLRDIFHDKPADSGPDAAVIGEQPARQEAIKAGRAAACRVPCRG